MQNDFNYDIFLSHSSKDKEKVRAVAAFLETNGLAVWFDEKCIGPGDDIFLAIENGLQTSRNLLLFISPDALKSDWVSLEKNTVIFRDPSNKLRKLIPVVIEDCELPDTLKRYKYIKHSEESNQWLDDILSACSGTESVETDRKIRKTKRRISRQNTASETVSTLSQFKLKPSKDAYILYVDDEEKSLSAFKRTFCEEYAILTASSVNRAIELINANKNTLGVVITDQRMPQKTGVDLLKILREEHPNIIRVLTTAYSDFKSLTDAVNLGSIHAFISKPWEAAEVQIVLARALDAHQVEKKRSSALIEKSTRLNQIVRGIDFPPTQFSAAVQMLSYFGTILKKRHPQYNPAISLTQQGNRVTMKIDPVDSPPEVVEAELDEYGRLLIGSITLQEYTTDEILADGIKHQMHSAANQIPPASSEYLPTKSLETANQGKNDEQRDPVDNKDREIERLTIALKTALKTDASHTAQNNEDKSAADHLWQGMNFQLLQHSLIVLIDNLQIESSFFDLYNLNETYLIRVINHILVWTKLGRFFERLGFNAPRIRFSVVQRLRKELTAIKTALSALDGVNLSKDDLIKSTEFANLKPLLEEALTQDSDISLVIAKVYRGPLDTKIITAHYNILARWCAIPIVESPSNDKS